MFPRPIVYDAPGHVLSDSYYEVIPLERLGVIHIIDKSIESSHFNVSPDNVEHICKFPPRILIMGEMRTSTGHDRSTIMLGSSGVLLVCWLVSMRELLEENVG